MFWRTRVWKKQCWQESGRRGLRRSSLYPNASAEIEKWVISCKPSPRSIIVMKTYNTSLTSVSLPVHKKSKFCDMYSCGYWHSSIDIDSDIHVHLSSFKCNLDSAKILHENNWRGQERTQFHDLHPVLIQDVVESNYVHVELRGKFKIILFRGCSLSASHSRDYFPVGRHMWVVASYQFVQEVLLVVSSFWVDRYDDRVTCI